MLRAWHIIKLAVCCNNGRKLPSLQLLLLFAAAAAALVAVVLVVVGADRG